MLSSLHEVLGDSRQLKELVKAPSKFVPHMVDCPKHGPFQVNRFVEGKGEIWLSFACPLCKAERLRSNAKIPPLFDGVLFDSFVVDGDEKKKNALLQCKQYANDLVASRKSNSNIGNLILTGPPGIGKNHLSVSILNKALDSGLTALCSNARGIVDEYFGVPFEQRDTWINNIGSIDILFIDEIGRVYETKGAQDSIFNIIDARYVRRKPTILASNLNKAAIIASIGEAAYDRIRSGGTKIINLTGTSYRR